MADAEIVAVGPAELGLVTDLYNEVFTPPTDEALLQRRFLGRHNICTLVAVVEKAHLGFIVGFELTPTTFYTWVCGVQPDARRLGIATQLMRGQEAWAKEHHYTTIRFECQNQHRPMLHVAITEGYDLVGIRWDTDTAHNVVIFEKELS